MVLLGDRFRPIYQNKYDIKDLMNIFILRKKRGFKKILIIYC